jgi:hypothetical protein
MSESLHDSNISDSFAPYWKIETLKDDRKTIARTTIIFVQIFGCPRFPEHSLRLVQFSKSKFGSRNRLFMGTPVTATWGFLHGPLMSEMGK